MAPAKTQSPIRILALAAGLCIVFVNSVLGQGPFKAAPTSAPIPNAIHSFAELPVDPNTPTPDRDFRSNAIKTLEFSDQFSRAYSCIGVLESKTMVADDAAILVGGETVPFSVGEPRRWPDAAAPSIPANFEASSRLVQDLDRPDSFGTKSVDHPLKITGPDEIDSTIFPQEPIRLTAPATPMKRTDGTAPNSMFNSQDETWRSFTGIDQSNEWWKEAVLNPFVPTGVQKYIDTNSVVYETLQHSPRIKALSQDPLIRDLDATEADSDFDPVSFVRSQFQDRVDPVGDNLSTTLDGSPFLQEHLWNGEAGLRRKLRNGATVELSQRLGFQNSNSSFFTPQDQGTASLALNVTQPLMRGRGKSYNRSQILIAQSVGGAAWDTFSAELQDEIQRSIQAYWRLYFDRSVFLQKKRNVLRGDAVLKTLVGRRELDSLPSQIARARSAVQTRKIDLANARRDIRDSETEIRRLTANKNWKANQTIELLPLESPTNIPLQYDLEFVVDQALANRPEIRAALKRAKIAAIERDISTNELMPELSLLLGTYVSALEGQSDIGQAIADQFGQVKPGYSVGIEFELPIGNRAARARLAQRNFQIAKIKAEVELAIQNVIAECQVSYRRVTSAQETIEAAASAIAAARDDLQQNLIRWKAFGLVEGDFADGQTPTTVLDQLLNSQERLTAAELTFAESELELKTAEVALRRTMGTLLVYENVRINQHATGNAPIADVESPIGFDE